MELVPKEKELIITDVADITEVITEVDAITVDAITDEIITGVAITDKSGGTEMISKVESHGNVTDNKAVGDITVDMNVEKLTDCIGDLRRLEYYEDINYSTAEPEIQKLVKTDLEISVSDKLKHDFIQNSNSELSLMIEPPRTAHKDQIAGAYVLQ